MANPIIKEDLERVLSIIKTEQFQQSGEIRAQTFEALSILFKQIVESERQEIRLLLAHRLGWPVERVAPTMALPSKVDLRRAVQWAPRSPRRAADETLFPTEGWIGGYLLYAQENESPLAWHFWSAVTLIGAACQRHVYLDRGAYCIWPNYYTILIGPSGSGKTIAINMATDIIERVNFELEQDDDWPEDRRIRLLPQTVTPLMLLSELKTGQVYDTIRGQVMGTRWKSSCGLIANDELTTIMGRTNFHSAKLVQIFTALYQCPDKWKDAAFMRGQLELRDVSLSALFGSAPEWIRDEVSEAMLKGGFINRCIFSNRESGGTPRSKPGINDPIVANALASQLVELVKAPFMGMTMDEDAEKWFDDWYMNLKNAPKVYNINLEDSYTRKPMHVLKLGMILAISRNIHNRVIYRKDLELALALLDQEEKYLPKMFDDFGATPESQREDFVLSIIKRHGTWMSRKEIGRATYKKMTGASSVDRILKSLRKRGALDHTVGKWRQAYYRVAASEASSGVEASSAAPPQKEG